MVLLEILGKFLALFALWSQICHCLFAHECEVHIEESTVTGLPIETRNERLICGFIGIRYAKPPIGPLRFKDPVPYVNWKKDLVATKDGPVCFQRESLNPANSSILTGNEDCLFLSVYTPYGKQSTSSKKLPVLVYIYGDGWQQGSNERSLYGPEFWLDEDIVLVTFNYRLNIFGFLSTGDEVAPGNFGLKDQNLVLKWVKRHIVYFGGDSSQITLVGEGAGGAAVHANMISPLSQRYIKRAISMSGNIQLPVAVRAAETVAESTKQMATLVGCPSHPSAALLKCMRTIPPEMFIRKEAKLPPAGVAPYTQFFFIPVEDYNISANPFYPPNPRLAARNNTLPWLTGADIHAGSVFVCFIYAYPDYVERVKTSLRRYLRLLLSLDTYFYEEDVAAVLKEILNHYFKNGYSQKALIRVFTDRFFLIPFANTAIQHKGRVYTYIDDYLFPQSYVNLFGPPGAVKTKPGISDILQFFFRLLQLFPDRKDSAATTRASEAVLGLWTNFIKNGKPTRSNDHVKWAPLGKEGRFDYLLIDNSQSFAKVNDLFRESYDFWEYLREKYGTQY